MTLNIILGITIWMVIGNFWVDLLNNLTLKIGNKEFTILERVIQLLIWPYSIFLFMKSMENEMENRGDNPATRSNVSTMDDILNTLDEYIAGKLDMDLEIYRYVIYTKCTDEEYDDIINAVIGSGSKEEIERVKKILNSKLNK